MLLGLISLLHIKLVINKKEKFSHGLLLSIWPCKSRLGSALLEGTGRHRLQKEWRHGRSLGSLLLRFNLQIGQVSISPKVPCCLDLSSSAGKLSASFSTIMTISSLPAFLAFTSIFRLMLPDFFPVDQSMQPCDGKQRITLSYNCPSLTIRTGNINT